MLLPPEIRIRTAADLTLAWRLLRGRLRFAEQTLWILGIGDGRVGPLFVVEGLRDGPHRTVPGELDALVGDYLAGATTAVLYGRPGAGPWGSADHAWARYAANWSDWPVHLAHDTALTLTSCGTGPERGTLDA